MGKKFLLFSIAIIAALALIIAAIIQMMPETVQPEPPVGTAPAAESAQTEPDTQMPEETEHTHVISEEWTAVDGTHFKICTADGCAHVQDEETCSGGTADCMQRACCAVCGAEYGELGSHRWSEEWTSIDAEHHAHICATPGCAVMSAAEPHAFPAESDGTAEKICSLCGYRVAPASHAHSLIAVAEVAPNCTSAGNSAYYRCGDCGKLFADSEGRQEIADLSHTVIPATAHSSDGKWQSNDNWHWSACAFCGAELDKAEHAAGAAVQMDAQQHWYTCVCGQPMNYSTHSDASRDGKCDVCGYALPVPETTAGQQENQAISREGEALEEILRPAQITILHPVASGTLTKSSSDAVIDYSNHTDGYVMVRYTQDARAHRRSHAR